MKRGKKRLNLAVDDLVTNWHNYRKRYEQWLQRQKAKVTPRRKKPGRLVERNITLTGNFMCYLMAQPRILEALPDKFELVILPEDDPALRRYNLDLLDTFGSEGRAIVFVRLKSSKDTDFKATHPQVYTPIAT